MVRRSFFQSLPGAAVAVPAAPAGRGNASPGRSPSKMPSNHRRRLQSRLGSPPHAPTPRSQGAMIESTGYQPQRPSLPDMDHGKTHNNASGSDPLHRNDAIPANARRGTERAGPDAESDRASAKQIRRLDLTGTLSIATRWRDRKPATSQEPTTAPSPNAWIVASPSRPASQLERLQQPMAPYHPRNLSPGHLNHTCGLQPQLIRVSTNVPYGHATLQVLSSVTGGQEPQRRSPARTDHGRRANNDTASGMYQPLGRGRPQDRRETAAATRPRGLFCRPAAIRLCASGSRGPAL